MTHCLPRPYLPGLPELWGVGNVLGHGGSYALADTVAISVCKACIGGTSMQRQARYPGWTREFQVSERGVLEVLEALPE